MSWIGPNAGTVSSTATTAFRVRRRRRPRSLWGASTGIEEPPTEPTVPSLLPLTEVSYTLEGIDAESLAALLSALPLPRSPFTVKLTVTADPMQAGMKVG